MKAANYKPASRADAHQYAQFIMENFERADWPTKRRRRKRRSMSLARVIACAKQAGADVIINADGSRTIVTCPTEPHGSVATGAHAPFDINDWDGAL